jgi:predicted Zn-dependent protease
MSKKRSESHHSSLIAHLFGTRRPIRLAIAALIALTLGAGYYRYRFERRKVEAPVPLIGSVRRQLGLAPVRESEEALSARPDDPRLRLRLADACAATGDPVGAALALYPLVAGGTGGATQGVEAGTDSPHPMPRAPDPALVARFVRDGARVGWREEAAAALRRSPAAAPRAWLELADAFAAHGEGKRAVALLAELERDRASALGVDEWLDGAMTWYQSRQPRRAAQWAQSAIVRQEPRGGMSGAASRRVAAGPAEERSVAARALQARCLLAAGEPEAALQALPGSADDPLVRYWRARTGLRSRGLARQKAALEYLAQLGMQEPADPVAAFEAGRASLGAGQAATAAALLSRAARGSYQELLCYRLLAQAYTALRQPAREDWARGREQSARGQFAAAAASLRHSLALDPSPPGAALDLARALSLLGEPRTALAVLEQAQRRHPRDVDLALGRAEALNRLDRFSEQASALEAAAAMDPSRAGEAQRNLGKMYYETRQFDQVVPVLERAVQASETDTEAHRFLGLADALHPDDPVRAERAVRHLLRAAALDPTDSVQWTTAGSLLQRLGYPREAAACYRRAIAGDSVAEAPYVALAQALQREGRPVEARLLLKLYRERRDLHARRRQLENRVNANRRDAVAHYALGDLLLRTDSYRNAYPYLLIAASLRPRWGSAQLRLADVCALLDYVDLWQAAERAAG